MVKKDYLQKFQDYLHDQIPDVIYHLLRKTGYDTSIAIQTIDSDVIKQIEEYINTEKIAHKKETVELLKKANYVNVEQFSFLLGHKALLLGLKRKSEEFDSLLAQLAQNETKSVHNVIKKSAKTIRTENSADREEAADTAETSENKEEDQIPSQLLSEALHNRVIHFVEHFLNIDGQIVVKDVKNLKLDFGVFEKIKSKNGAPGFKCYLKCLFCSIRKPCTYYKHWQASNYESHLKSESVLIRNRNESVLENNKENDSEAAKSAEKSANISANNTKVSAIGYQTKKSDETISEREPTAINSSKTSTSQNTQRLSINAALQEKIDSVLRIDTLDLGDRA